MLLNIIVNELVIKTILTNIILNEPVIKIILPNIIVMLLNIIVNELVIKIILPNIIMILLNIIVNELIIKIILPNIIVNEQLFFTTSWQFIINFRVGFYIVCVITQIANECAYFFQISTVFGFNF
jgi:hypothetical protein